MRQATYGVKRDLFSSQHDSDFVRSRAIVRNVKAHAEESRVEPVNTENGETLKGLL